MAVLTGKARAALPDSAFAFIEGGHEDEKVDGRTPDKYRHYPVHDASHVKNALSRIAQGTRFAKEARPKIMAAAKKHGIDHDESAETGRSLESLFPEVRFVSEAPEFRMAEGSGDPHITGYAAVFGKLSRKLGGFMEVIEPRAFDASRSAGFPDVVCRYNHREDMILGTTAAGTLRVEVDERGMYYDVLPPKHRADVVELVQRGDVRYSSFAFRCLEPGVDDSWGVTLGNFPLRTLHNAQVVDTAPVFDPAYSDTSAAARNMTGAVESLARWVDAPVDEVRSYLSAGQAMKFFKRSDRPSAPAAAPEVPSLSKDASEARMLDDPAIAVRNWRWDTSGPAEPAAPEATEARESDQETDEERRARTAHFMAHENLCRRYVHGEPCVRPAGHADDCNGPCYGRKDGLPCSQPGGHEGDHEPMAISNSRSAGDEGTETRDGAEATGEAAEPEAEGDESAAEDEAQRSAQMAQMERDLAEMRMRQLAFEQSLDS